MVDNKEKSGTIFSFPELRIQCLPKSRRETSLRERDPRGDPYRNGILYPRTKINWNVARMAFQVFLPDSNKEYTIPDGFAISEPIYNTKKPPNFAIKRLSDSSAPISGGKDMMMFCSPVDKNDVEIIICEDNDKRDRWFAPAIFSPEDVHEKVAIAFKTPAYHDQSVEKDVECLIFLKQRYGNRMGKPIKFTLKKEDHKHIYGNEYVCLLSLEHLLGLENVYNDEHQSNFRNTDLHANNETGVILQRISQHFEAPSTCTAFNSTDNFAPVTHPGLEDHFETGFEQGSPWNVRDYLSKSATVTGGVTTNAGPAIHSTSSKNHLNPYYTPEKERNILTPLANSDFEPWFHSDSWFENASLSIISNSLSKEESTSISTNAEPVFDAVLPKSQFNPCCALEKELNISTSTINFEDNFHSALGKYISPSIVKDFLSAAENTVNNAYSSSESFSHLSLAENQLNQRCHYHEKDMDLSTSVTDSDFEDCFDSDSNASFSVAKGFFSAEGGTNNVISMSTEPAFQAAEGKSPVINAFSYFKNVAYDNRQNYY